MSSDLDLVTGAPATGQWFSPSRTAPVVARRFAKKFLVGAGADLHASR
jgi:hypothetical protein